MLVVALWAISFPHAAQALLRLDITEGTLSPLPIAITSFKAEDGQSKLAQNIVAVIQSDLEGSGLFEAIDRRAFIQSLSGVDAVPQFSDWRKINAQALVTGTLTIEKGDMIQAKFRLWDVPSGKQSVGKAFSSPQGNWRRMAHLIADEIYTRLTGESAYFDSRVVYVAESGDQRRRTKRLAVMDQDGANHVYLTSGKTLVLTPRFDRLSQRIIYLAYYNNKPNVYLYDLETGREDLLGRFPGMSFAPRFSPDGDSVVMSIARDGNSDIYVMDLKSRRLERVTNHFAIDTSPSFSPDGSQIVFNSDRAGSQQLYVMQRDGKNAKRISFGSGSYATPVWSPRGDYIAFTKMHRGKFHIGVMKPDGSGERLLTESYLDEGPTWSPNGRVILFSRQAQGRGSQSGEFSLHSIDITGYNEREIPTPQAGSDPAWSPLLGK